jgi:hypothetical protein
MKEIGRILFATFWLVVIPRASVAQDDIKISVNPEVLRPVNGKLPQSLNIEVYAQTCSASTNFLQESPNSDKSSGTDKRLTYSLWATGGLTPTNSKNGKCSIASTLTIDPSLPAGTYDIILLKDDKPVGRAGLTVLDAAAGAIPPGLAPQVDVLWTILSNKIASDVFGKRVAQRFYCIEVKIGNNSGYALQIAGIGFHNKNVFGEEVRQANASYASTRAVLQREEILSNRNIAYHLLQAGGLLMASFTPFFTKPNSKAHFSAASAIVSGALLQAFDIVGPDRVPGQLNNLDDESLRDGSVIQNNTQVRTMVFVEKRELTEALQQAASEMLKKAINTTGLGRLEQTTIAKSEEPGMLGGGSESPFLIRKALGNLVIVGDPIEYLPRVQIESSSSQQSGSVSLSATSLSFTKSQPEQKVTLTNTGTGSLTINSVTVTEKDTHNFEVTTNTCGTTVAAGANCVITVKFTPPSTGGTQSATLGISDSASGSPHTVNLSATVDLSGTTQ